MSKLHHLKYLTKGNH